MADGVEKFGAWFRKRGWLGTEEGVRLGVGEDGKMGVGRGGGSAGLGVTRRGRWWGRGEVGVRMVVE